MFMKSLRVGFVGLVLSIATALAGPSAIQGVVKDAKGQAIKGADVRVESKDGKQQFTTVKTDAKGGYISQGLPAGVYRVTLTVNGAVKASITNTKTKAGQTTQLNFDLKPVAASQASAAVKKGKHMVWMPPTTGSHTGGRWVEVDDNAKSDPGALNVQRANAEQLQQQMRSVGNPNRP
jgi:carboxypeptidase family protein